MKRRTQGGGRKASNPMFFGQRMTPEQARKYAREHNLPLPPFALTPAMRERERKQWKKFKTEMRARCAALKKQLEESRKGKVIPFPVRNGIAREIEALNIIEGRAKNPFSLKKLIRKILPPQSAREIAQRRGVEPMPEYSFERGAGARRRPPRAKFPPPARRKRGARPATPHNLSKGAPPLSGTRADVASALLGLGYKRPAAEAMARQAEGSTFDALLRSALRKQNPGQGYLFDFHGAFNDKKDAEAKEAKVPGSFIKMIATKSGFRWAVVTPVRQNPKSKVLVSYQEALKRLPKSLAGSFDPLTHKTVSDLASLAQHELNLYEEGEPSEIRNAAMQRVVARYLRNLRALGVQRKRNVEFGEYSKGVFHPWTMLPVSQRKRAKMGAPVTPRSYRKNTRRHGTQRNPVHTSTRRYIVRITETKYGRVRGDNSFEKYAKPDSVSFFVSNSGGRSPFDWQAKRYRTRKGAEKAGQARSGIVRSWVNGDVQYKSDYEVIEYTKPNPTANSRQPKASTKRTNPSTQARAAKLYEQFHGAPSNEVIEVIEAYGATPAVVEKVKGMIPPEDFAKLGDLVKLIIAQPGATRGDEIEFGANERPILASNADADQLYIIAGNQNVTPLLKGLRASDVLVDLGELVQVEYQTRKRMDKFQPVVYYHKLGEETGERPRLLFDRERKHLYIVGGNYKVKPEGITN